MTNRVVHVVPDVIDRRELDTLVKAIYDAHSTAGDRLSRDNYASLVRGGANAVHRFGETFVPRTDDGKVHIITNSKGQFA